ncbi:GNAT family N-acetyltransferase [Streptomyces flavofungini]|uniref:GNAT family N-acetyltransferase n=1 Tax=Streptomyces flavofungini TaxID=68200 RepID=UPI0034DF9F1E
MIDQDRPAPTAVEAGDGAWPPELSRPAWTAENTVLRRVEPGDWEVILRLESSSPYQRAWERVTAPRSPDHCREWLKQEAARDPLDDNFFLAITDRRHGEMVGCVNTNQADPVAGRFYLGMAVAPEHQRKRYAWETGLLLFHYMFGERRYQKAQAYVHDFNQVSQAAMLAFGARLEGRLRRHDFIGGRYRDNLIFGLTSEEFYAGHGADGTS